MRLLFFFIFSLFRFVRIVSLILFRCSELLGESFLSLSLSIAMFIRRMSAALSFAIDNCYAVLYWMAYVWQVKYLMYTNDYGMVNSLVAAMKENATVDC